MKAIRFLWHFFVYRTSVATRILTAFTALVLLNSILLSNLWFTTMRTHTYENSRNAFDNVVEHEGDALMERVRPLQAPGWYFSNNEAFLAGLQSENYTEEGRELYYTHVADPQLTSILTMFADISSIVIYHDNPQLDAYSGMIRELREVENEPWVRMLEETDRLWGIEGDELCLYSRAPSLYPDAPTVLMDVRMKCDVAFNMEISSAARYALSVTQASGELLWMDNRLGVEDQQISELMKAAPGETAAEKSGYYVLSIPLNELNWTLTAVVPHEQLMTDARMIERSGMTIIFSCLIITLLVAILLSRSLAKRIRHLKDSMERVMAGDWSVSIQTDYQDEIGALTRQFNELVKRLHTSMDELRNAERKEKEAEIKALQAQINPHFLYNTLSLIAWKAIEQGADNVAQIVRAFSRFCRSVLNRGVTESFLRNEIHMVQGYVDIQREMHDYSFEVEYEIPQAYEMCIVPNFILQPLVENAIIYGIEKLDGEPGRMCITVKECEGKLCCCVMNNGGSFDEAALREALSSTRSYGLRNVQERVQYLCGKDCGIFIGEAEAPYTTCVYLKLNLGFSQPHAEEK